MINERPPFDIDAVADCARLIEQTYRMPGVLYVSVIKGDRCRVTLDEETFTELFSGKEITERHRGSKSEYYQFEYSSEYKGVTFTTLTHEKSELSRYSKGKETL